MRCLLRRKRRAVHTPEVALLSILSVTLWCACVGRELVQSHNMVYAAVTGGIFHATVSPSASSSLWGSVSGALAVSVSRPRAGAHAARGGRRAVLCATRNWSASHVDAAIRSCVVLRHEHALSMRLGGTHRRRHAACTSLAYMPRCTPHPPAY